MNTLHTPIRLPEFVDTRLNFFIDSLLDTKDTGRNLVLGLAPQETDINLQSNDYLNLSYHPDIIDAQIRSLASKKGTPFMSNVFLQADGLDKQVEQQLARFVGFDSCIVSASGWTANVGLLQTICDSSTNVYIDFFAHMSLWEGARIAGANIHPFMHNNVRHLKKLINRNGPGIVLIDSVYSTLGTIARLEEIIATCNELNCAIVVDESHSLGTHGPSGAGLLQEHGLTKQVDFLTASLAKTFAYRAGAIWCNNRFGDCLPYVAFPSIFSSAVMTHELERIEATLKVIRGSDLARNKLHQNAKRIRNALRGIGFDIRSETQIIALETGGNTETRIVRDYLESHGVFGSVFCPPATPNNKNVIRLSIDSQLTDGQIDHLINVCSDAYDKYFAHQNSFATKPKQAS
ncbi:alpha-hydroxyketone-type quorum-sensing autoinducer synthase [Vibrio paucivorans]